MLYHDENKRASTIDVAALFNSIFLAVEAAVQACGRPAETWVALVGKNAGPRASGTAWEGD